MIDLRGLTLIRPMSAAIVHGTKRIENRPRDLPKAMRGIETVVAVHAGKSMDGDYWRTIRKIDGDGDGRVSYYDRIEDEGIVGLMLLTGQVHTIVPSVRVSTKAFHLYDKDDGKDHPVWIPNPWFSGPFGYEIKHAIAFPQPLACRGSLGWWRVPADAAEVIHASGHVERLLYEAAVLAA